MNKDQLAKELLEKIKEGIKPSDLKKQKQQQNINHQIPTPPDSPIITPIDKSRNNKKELNTDKDKKIKELQKGLDFWKATANNYLSSLQKLTAENDGLRLDLQELQQKPIQLNQETEQALQEANQKIRDLNYLLKSKNLQKKLTDEIKEVVKEGDKPSQVKEKIQIKNSVGLETSQKLFNVLCDTCGNYKPNQHLNLKKLNSGLGMDLTKLYQMCDDCVNSGRFDIKKERNNEHDLLNW